MQRGGKLDFSSVEQYVTDKLVDAFSITNSSPAYAMLSCRQATECIVQYQYQIENPDEEWINEKPPSITSILYKCNRIRPQICEVIESINGQTRGEMHFNRDRLGNNSAKSEDVVPIVSDIKRVFYDLFDTEIETNGISFNYEEKMERIHQTIIGSFEENPSELNHLQFILSAADFAQKEGVDLTDIEVRLSETHDNVESLSGEMIHKMEEDIHNIKQQNEMILKLLNSNPVVEEESTDVDELEQLFNLLDNQRKPQRDDTFFDSAQQTTCYMSPHDYGDGIYIKPTGNAAEPLLIHMGLLKCIRDSNLNELIQMSSTYNLVPKGSVEHMNSKEDVRKLQTLLIWHLVLNDMDLSAETLHKLPTSSVENLCVIFLIPTMKSKDENIGQLTDFLTQATLK